MHETSRGCSNRDKAKRLSSCSQSLLTTTRFSRFSRVNSQRPPHLIFCFEDELEFPKTLSPSFLWEQRSFSLWVSWPPRSLRCPLPPPLNPIWLWGSIPSGCSPHIHPRTLHVFTTFIHRDSPHRNSSDNAGERRQQGRAIRVVGTGAFAALGIVPKCPKLTLAAPKSAGLAHLPSHNEMAG